MNDQAIAEILERVRNRFYGKYRGTVTDIEPKTLRLKAKVPAVLGQQKTGWCMPCVPYAGADVGFVFLPEVGSGVWIEFEGGDVSYPIWSGCYWRTDELPAADAKAQVKAIVTKTGHKLILDDDTGSITITDGNNNTVILESSGITLERGGKKIEISDAQVNINSGSLEVI